MKTIAALTFALLLAAPARAIELSLEENRAERGSVGYVDMQRLFNASPDAQRAKEGFEELVRQAEERVNLRKAEILKLRQQLEADRAERAAIAASASSAAVVAPPAPPAETPAAVPPSSPAPAAAAVSTGAAPAPAGKVAAMALPGMAAPEPAPGAPPAASSSSTAGLDSLLEPQAAKSTAAAVAVVSTAAAGMFPAPPPAPAAAPAPSGPTVGQSLLELDAKIIQLESDLARKESELTRESSDADHGLLDVESRKTDQVLARLYRALVEVSRREGVSVVVDKTTILYGHPAVDLTDRVLKYLREQP
jgi:Skp family chaperone for outer membrane proteins